MNDGGEEPDLRKGKGIHNNDLTPERKGAITKTVEFILELTKEGGPIKVLES